jgi:hypothetical protein
MLPEWSALIPLHGQFSPFALVLVRERESKTTLFRTDGVYKMFFQKKEQASITYIRKLRETTIQFLKQQENKADRPSNHQKRVYDGINATNMYITYIYMIHCIFYLKHVF